MFCNYEFGWARSIYDWTIFQLTKVRQKCMKSEELPYKLIGDVAYPIQPWMYSPLKGRGVAGLEDYKAN